MKVTYASASVYTIPIFIAATVLLLSTGSALGREGDIKILPAEAVFAYSGAFPAKINYKLSIPIKRRDRLLSNPQLQIRIFFTNPIDLAQRGTRAKPDKDGCVPFTSWVTKLNLYEVENFVVLLNRISPRWLQVRNDELLNRQISIIVEEFPGQTSAFPRFERVRVRQDKATEYFKAALTVDIGGIEELSPAAYRQLVEQLKAPKSKGEIADTFCVQGLQTLQAEGELLVASFGDCRRTLEDG